MTLRALIVTILVVSCAHALTAQEPGDPFARRASEARPGIDSVRVGFEISPLWHGLLLGTGAVTGYVDFAILGYPTSGVGDWGLSAHVDGATVIDARSAAVSTDRIGGGLTVARYIRGGDGAVALVANPYWTSRPAGDDTGIEVGFRVDGVEWSWGLEEIDPALSFRAFRDMGFLEAWRAEADFNLQFGAQNVRVWGFAVTAWLEGTAWWADYETGLASSDGWGGRYGLGGAFDRSLLAVSLRLGNSHALDASSRLYAETALRIWPDGRDR